MNPTPALLGLALLAAVAAPAASGPFELQLDAARGIITSLRRAGDPDRVEFIRAGSALGAVRLSVRTGDGPWRDLDRATNGIDLRSEWRVEDGALLWDITVRNTGGAPVELGELALPLPMNTDYVWDHEETFVRRVFRHAHIAGHGSYLYWLPVRGTGSFLVMQPRDGTSLEFFTATGMDYAYGREKFAVFVHSVASAARQPRGTWRQPRTSRVLAPGAASVSRFAFRWTNSHQGIRDLLFRHGGVDLQVIPGLVVPRDLSATLAVRTRIPVALPEAEFPALTRVEALPAREPGTQLFRVRFQKLGENRLTLRGPDGWSMPVECFVTEPLETLIRKRSAFIVEHQQHRDPDRWYNGLFSVWDRRQPEGRNLLGPDHTGGQHPYAVSGSDDPSNGKCLLVAEKNAAHPDAREVAALEYFVRNFVWGRHQRTADEKPFPYGIYGTDSWKENRFATRDPIEQAVSRPGGPGASKMWRTFDYPTYFALYFNLYRIARQRPDLVRELTAADYLERAFGTALAYFEVPAQIRMEGGWSFTGWVHWQYTVGNFHEKYLLPLIAALESEGRPADAARLRREWEKKVKYFIYDNPWPFASEMPVDSTAYESTYAAARYALERGLRPDTNLWHDRNLGKWFSHPVIDPRRHRDFLNRQHAANLACRGVLEPHYWSLGSDFRGCGSASYTLSYMSAMGGWALLDQALRFDADPAANLRLGYASLLASWALLNSGDAASNHGFWTPGKLHDGAMSWGFQPRQSGTEWAPATRDLPRGAWPVCGEADHGLVAAIETASTIVRDDPLFGLTALGGELTGTATNLSVLPRDGVRQRLHWLVGTNRVSLELDRDGFAADEPVTMSPSLDRGTFTLESRSPREHTTVLTVTGWPADQMEVNDGDRRRVARVRAGEPVRMELAVPGGRNRLFRLGPPGG